MKIWFVLRTYGLEGLKAYIRRHVGLGELFGSLLESRADLFRILSKPAFGLTVFYAAPRRIAPEAPEPEDPSELNSLTTAIYERVLQRKDLFLTKTEIHGLCAIRVVSANAKAEEKYVRRAFDIIVDAAEETIRCLYDVDVKAQRESLSST